MQCVDEVIDVSVVTQRGVPTIQTVQKTAEEPQTQFFDRRENVPQTTEEIVEAIQSMLQEQNLERVIEETDVLVPHEEEEIIEVVGQIPQEQLQGRAMEQTVAVPIPRVMEE